MPTRAISISSLNWSFGFGLWAAVTIGGYLASRHYAEPCRTRRSLPANYRLAESDLKCNSQGKAAEITGLYLTRNLDANKNVIAGDVAQSPTLTPPSGQKIVLVDVSEQPGLLRTLNAGSTVTVTDGAAILQNDIEVLALNCDDRGGKKCYAELAVPAALQVGMQAAAAKLRLCVTKQ